MKHIFSQKSLLSSSIKSSAGMANQQQVSSEALRNPALQLVKYAGMAVFFAASLSLSACGDKDAATQTAPSSNDEPVATSTDAATDTQAPVEASPEADSASVDEGAAASEAPADVPESTQAAEQPEVAETAQTPAAAPEPELAAGAGKELYESHCKQCHEGGLLGAPKFGDKAAWAPRIEQGKEALYIHSAKGYKKMPAQVNGDVSVAQVHAAVDYMVEHSS